jgi:hypothetical protein
VGGNAFLLDMLKAHSEELGVSALPEELQASAQRSQSLLAHDTADLVVSTPRTIAGRLVFNVTVHNRTGHKFPTAYPARRAWLHVAVLDSLGRVVFESGAPRADGSIVGNDNDADPTKFEPHWKRITEPDQVEIYESIMGDFRDRVTTGLLFGTHYLKDNRLLPTGFEKETAGPLIQVVGDAKSDPGFQAGSDTVQYDVAVRDGHGYRVSADLLYESIGYRWAHNLDGYEAEEPQRFRTYYASAVSNAVKTVANASNIAP